MFPEIFLGIQYFYRHLIFVELEEKTVALQYLLHLPIFHYKLEKLPPLQLLYKLSVAVKLKLEMMDAFLFKLEFLFAEK